MLNYRPYQSALVDDIRAAWQQGHDNPIAVLPTGGGKTVVFSGIAAAEGGPVCAIAHRQELVGQMSLSLARYGVMHRIIGPPAVIKRAIASHVEETGQSFYQPHASVAVAGVDTLIRRHDALAAWLPRVGLWIIDEGHHVLEGNKWGTAVEMFPNARGLLVTATPTRADGKGLGRHADGVADVLVTGPTMRELINDGWLTDYTIYAPPGDYHRPDDVGSTGDFKPAAVKASIRKSHIIGDVVTHYQRIAPGRLGVTFASDVESATDIADQFNASGIPTAVVSAKTPDSERAAILRKFRRRELTMLVNVDLFGEGFDLPAIEVVIMARPTESFSLYAQQFGRALRLMLTGPTPDTVQGRLAAIAASGKPRAIIIDHVGNVIRHGLPDARREWTLDATERNSRGSAEDAVPLRSCLNPECMQVYERFHPACPFCGDHPVPASRSAPEFVDGDLTELDAETLARMRGEVEAVDLPADEYRAQLAAKKCPTIGQHAHVKRHLAQQEAQTALREAMALWAGHHKAQGRSDAESYRRFYLRFGIDALSAQALNTAEAGELTGKVMEDVGR